MSTAIITTDTYKDHQVTPGHPENEGRVTAIIEKLKLKKNKLIWKKQKKFDYKIIEDTHGKKFTSNILGSFPKEGFGFFDPDTPVVSKSKQAAIDVIGGAIQAVDGIEKKNFNNAFVVARPPGHHSGTPQGPKGFCTFNNISIATNYLINKYKYKRIAVVDVDVHHGDGSQSLFWDNKNVFFASTHQGGGFYPGTGKENEKGKYNNIMNIPMEAGTNSEEYLNAYDRILSKLKLYKPEFILMSFGIDGHKDDPIGQMKLSSNDYYTITKRTLEIAKQCCDGKFVSLLEGGYHAISNAESSDEHVNALLEFN